jgi:hypothetical protein
MASVALTPESSPFRRLTAAVQRADARVYEAIRSAYGLLNHEREHARAFPLPMRLRMWRRGFYAESEVVYDFPRNDRRDYVSDYQHRIHGTWVNPFGPFYNHKLMLRTYLLSLGQAQPETVAVIVGDRIVGDPYGPGRTLLTPTQLRERLEEGASDGYVVKPEDELCGQGIFLLARENGAFVRRRGTASEPFELDHFLQMVRGPARGKSVNSYLIERRVRQAPFWAGLFPGSVNTIRALTLWTPGEPAPFLARAVQRIGTRDTVPTDNWAGGGISAPIELDTGRLGIGRMHPTKGRRGAPPFTHHPDTGAQIEGAVLPGWATIRATVLQAAASIPFNRMAGWDVLVREDGTPVLLEANGNSDVNLLQVHGGLLADPAIRRFYERVGMV